MKINIQLNQKSLKNAIKQLKQYQKRYEEAVKDFLLSIYDKITYEANKNLEVSDIGSNVKSRIESSWSYDFTDSGMIIRNNDDQSAYVEFGVGVVGAQLDHPNASKADYQYSIGSKIREDGSWIFNVTDDADIDISAKYVSSRTEHTVLTYGSPAVMYAYNALVDIQMGDTLKKLWEQSKKRYLG